MNRAARLAADRALNDLYAQVPDVGCRGLCQEACGPIGYSTREWERIRGRGVRLLPLVDQVARLLADGRYPCPALDTAGRCSVYDDRPMVCRLWGAVEEMPCPHGCVPAGGRLASGDGRALLHAADVAGR